MGHRANLAIRSVKGYDLYYSHWGANTLTNDLFWGLDHAQKFISMQRSVERDEWLDTIWAEGGVVLDIENKVLLLYGGENLLYDVTLRRLYLKCMRHMWKEWEVRWAYEGIVEIAEYLDKDRQSVIAEPSKVSGDPCTLTAPAERDWVSCIGSIKSGEELSIYPLDYEIDEYLRTGPALLVSSKEIQNYPSLNLAEWTDCFPNGGFHIDIDQKKLDFWLASDAPNLQIELSDVWTGWTLTWHKDSFESQVALTNSAIVFNHRSQSELLAELLQILDRDSKPIDVMSLANRLQDHHGGAKVEVNPFALQDERLPVDSENRKKILAECIASLELE